VWVEEQEAVTLTLDHLQTARRTWAIVDLVGKEATFEKSSSDWVRTELDDWLAAAAMIEESCSVGSTKLEGHGEMA